MRWLVAACMTFVGTGLLPASTTAASFPSTCYDPTRGFAIGVPSGWWVHPPDAERGIGQCERFGPVLFELTPSGAGVLVGEAISVGWIIDSCVGFVAPPTSNEAMDVAGRPASRIQTSPQDGAGSPEYKTTFYWVQLGDAECARDSDYLSISTSAAAGHYARNVEILDQMVQTIVLTLPDSAVPRTHELVNGLVLMGWLLVVSALAMTLVAYSQPRLRK